MPIRIVEPPEPLTAAGAQNQPLLIESDAVRSLFYELRRYCGQQIAGRSFLIAGHRGAGKTTSLQGAVAQLSYTIQTEAGNLAFRRGNRQVAIPSPTLQPLLVLLQGPNLLPPVEPAAKPASSSEASNASPLVTVSAASDGKNENPDKSTPSPMETVLIQITLALYRSLAEEFSRAYRSKAQRFLTSPATPAQERKFQRILETAARLELELDECEGVALLRQYWKLVGCLESGLLDLVSPAATSSRDQGYRELVALASACDAYRRICGKVTRSDEKTNSAQVAHETQLALTAKGSELSKSITSLLTGGVVASAALATNTSTAASVLAGLVAALASTLVFKISSTRSRKQDSKRSDLFIPDLTVATLDRLLPLLIQRIRLAGLAPIFMIDELDKIEQPSRIDDTLKVLKKLVAEKAFFCFLADRRYFEDLNQKLNDAPYIVESTFYSHRIFIVFKHQDLHTWLEKVMVLSDATLSEDAADFQLLPYLILHAARMHPIDVRRQLLAISNAAGEFKYPQGEIRSRPRFRFELSVQVAIELALEDPLLASEIDLRPELLQLAHDAVYYISRQWHSAPEHLVLSDSAGQKAFNAYLYERKASAPPIPLVTATTGSNPPESNLDPTTDTFNDDPAIAILMFQSVRIIASLLESPSELQVRAKNAGRPQVLLDALSPNPLLYLVSHETHVYRWHAYPSGADIPQPQSATPLVPAAPRRSTQRSQINFVLEFDRTLARLTNNAIDAAALSSQYGILPTSPAWSDVSRAMQRLDHAKRDAPYPERDADLAVLDQYTALLKTHSRGTALALAFSQAFDLLVMTPQKQFGMEIIASALRFQSIPATEVEDKLNTLIAELPALPNSEPLAFDPPILNQDDDGSPKAWQRWTETTAVNLQPFLQCIDIKSVEVLSKAWEYWEQRFRVSTALDPELSTILCRVWHTGPGQLLRFDLTSMVVGDWSNAFAEGVRALGLSGSQTPRWLTVIALQQLGFDPKRLQLVSGVFKTFLIDVPNLFAPPASSPDPVPLAAIVLSYNDSRVASWQPDFANPILWIATENNSVQLSPLLKAVLDALQFNFLSIDVTSTIITLGSTGVANPLSYINPSIISFADVIFPMRPPTPVIVDAVPGTSADHRFFFVTANSPQEFFAAIRETTTPPIA